MHEDQIVDHEHLMAFLEMIKSPDGNVRVEAQKSAGPMGAAAVAPLADLIASADKGTAKAAREALDTVAWYAARPSAAAHAVSVELLKVADSSRQGKVRVEALHLLGFTGDGRVVPGIVNVMMAAKDDQEQPQIREEARLALERIPGSASLNALKKAEQGAPADFRPNLEQSVYNRNLTPKTEGLLPAR
jgi:HEAT repeat protein